MLVDDIQRELLLGHGRTRKSPQYSCQYGDVTSKPTTIFLLQQQQQQQQQQQRQQQEQQQQRVWQ